MFVIILIINNNIYIVLIELFINLKICILIKKNTKV